jgi:hypothetical protein
MCWERRACAQSGRPKLAESGPSASEWRNTKSGLRDRSSNSGSAAPWRQHSATELRRADYCRRTAGLRSLRMGKLMPAGLQPLSHHRDFEPQSRPKKRAIGTVPNLDD